MSEKKSGPFGLYQGMTVAELDARVIDGRPGMYTLESAPRPHSAFESYVVQVGPTTGLCWIKAIGKTVNTNVFGHELQSAFNDMNERLQAAYGPPELSDLLLTGSIWSDPNDWMQALLRGERILMASWEQGKRKQTLKNQLRTVALIACALSTDTGYIAVEYEFPNAGQCEAEISSEEDSAL